MAIRLPVLMMKRMMILLIMVITICPCSLWANNMKGVLGMKWSASTLIDVAADLLDPSAQADGGGLQMERGQSDPLLDYSLHPKGIKHTAKGKSSERYMVPMLSTSVGDNNQIMEYMTAAVIARATNRTLCLTPFFNGPLKHTGKLPTGGLGFQERFDTKILSKFVKITSLENCLHQCNGQIDSFWWVRIRNSSKLDKHWQWGPKVRSHDFGGVFIEWSSTDDLRKAVQNFNEEENCVAIGGLFPGLRWRGAYLAPSLYMRPSESILQIAKSLQRLAIGEDRNFLAVHWRFEESLCDDKSLGLCFLRCADGAIIDSGLHATTPGLATSKATSSPNQEGGFVKETGACKHIVDSARVTVSKHDLVAAIVGKATKENVSSIYLATDGWLRGTHAQRLIREVVVEIRAKGIPISGLWKIKGLPNIIINGTVSIYRDDVMKKVSPVTLGAHAISKVEQEICFRASAFMGSGESTWSLAMFRARLASRRWKSFVDSRSIIQASHGEAQRGVVDDDDDDDDDSIIEELLQDSHAAGLQCRYQSLYKRAHLRKEVPQESYQDEAPDTWLDMEACEGQFGEGGFCKLLHCFPQNTT